MRFAFTALALTALGACAQIPDSAAGVGFDNSLADQRARQAAAQQPTASPVPPAAIISDEVRAPEPTQVQPVQTAASTLQPAAPVAATTIATPSPSATATTSATQTQDDAILEAAASLEQIQANSGVAPLQASPSNPAPQIVGNAGISDENDFQAVAARESIESDAQRIEQNREQYSVVQPTAVPTRSGTTQPNIVQYALETNHPIGTRVYTRTGFNLAARAQRNCAGFASADQAQIEFLASGGPRRDRKVLDPDGDGYACSWNPNTFRSAVQN